ncbi:lipoy [Sesbania bispinosa]|nr:lipoy [Sesbania bispinosa]
MGGGRQKNGDGCTVAHCNEDESCVWEMTPQRSDMWLRPKRRPMAERRTTIQSHAIRVMEKVTSMMMCNGCGRALCAHGCANYSYWLTRMWGWGDSGVTKTRGSEVVGVGKVSCNMDYAAVAIDAGKYETGV